jgi:hypothetical protein
MSRILRIVLAAAAALTGYMLVSVAMFVVFPQDTSAALGALRFLVSLGAAIGAGRAVWNRSSSSTGTPGLARAITLGALVVGGLGFIGGFFGPLLFAPGANQGPLLGILITGPLGVVVGAIGGAIHWLVRRKRTP